MKTIRLCIIMFALCCSASLFAQEELGNGMLFPQFEKGIVVVKDGTRSLIPLNYNMLQQEMVFLDTDSALMAIADPTDVLVVIFGERRFIPGSPTGSFYEEIPAGDGSFFVQRKANILSVGKAAGYGGYSQAGAVSSYGSIQTNSSRYEKLKVDEKFKLKIDCIYYLKTNNSFKKFYSAKTLGKLFKGHESEIEKYAKEQSVDFSKIGDITRIVEYGYSLTK